MTHMTTAAEWFDTFLAGFDRDPSRVRRAMSELYRPLPPAVLRQRAYDAETEHLRILGREARAAA